MKIFTQPLAACARISLILILLINIFNPVQCQVRMRANLFIVDNNSATLMDGNMTNYSNQYSNAVDGNDIWKMSNFGENFGVLRSAANLVIERRSLITISDTTYFRMWNVQARNYRIQVIAENLQQNNLIGFVRDKYLNQDIAIDLNDTTNVDFTVNAEAGSYAQNRFQLIYANLNTINGPLPVSFTGIHAERKNNYVHVLWTVQNEISIEKYIVEYSADGIIFKAQQEVLSSGNANIKNYAVADAQPENCQHFYRVKAIGTGEKIQYSTIVRTGAAANTGSINVYPNPVVNKTIQLQMDISLAGIYQLSITRNNGLNEPLVTLKLAAGQHRRVINLPANTAAGIYRLQLITPHKKMLVKTITVL